MAGTIRYDLLWQRIYRWMFQHGLVSCQVCGSTHKLTFDHIIPQVHGGPNTRDNMAILCSPCNNRKGCNYWNLEPISWPPPYFTLKDIVDLEVGDITIHGVVREVSDIKITLDRENSILSQCPKARPSRRKKDKPIPDEVYINEDWQWLVLHPAALDAKLIAH